MEDREIEQEIQPVGQDMRVATTIMINALAIYNAPALDPIVVLQ